MKTIQSRKKPSLAPVEAASAFGARGMIARCPGAVAKYSPSGEFIGWYVGSQTAGRPDSLMPTERYVDELEKNFRRELASLVKDAQVRAAGRASGSARRVMRDRIRAVAKAVSGHGTPERDVNLATAVLLKERYGFKKSTREIAKARAKRP